MKKVVPIIAIVAAVIILITAAAGLIAVAISATVGQIKLIAVPTAIVGLAMSLLAAPFAFLFRRDILCFVAFTIDLAALAMSIASIILWLTIL